MSEWEPYEFNYIIGLNTNDYVEFWNKSNLLSAS